MLCSFKGHSGRGQATSKPESTAPCLRLRAVPPSTPTGSGMQHAFCFTNGSVTEARPESNTAIADVRSRAMRGLAALTAQRGMPMIVSHATPNRCRWVNPLMQSWWSAGKVMKATTAVAIPDQDGSSPTHRKTVNPTSR